MSSSSILKPVVGSLPNAPQPKTLPLLKFNKSLQLKGKEKVELSLQETSITAVSRRELIGLAATTLGGLSLNATKPAEALEVADIGSSFKELLGFSKGKSKTGAGNKKKSKAEAEKKPKMDDKGKPKSEGDAKKPKVEGNGKKPKSETDEKKPKVEGHGNKPKNEEKPKVEGNGNKPKNEERPKVEANGNKPKGEADQKKPKDGDDKKASTTPHHTEKEKVPTSAAAPTLPNILNTIIT